jgi:hypothetical protein
MGSHPNGIPHATELSLRLLELRLPGPTLNNIACNLHQAPPRLTHVVRIAGPPHSRVCACHRSGMSKLLLGGATASLLTTSANKLLQLVKWCIATARPSGAPWVNLRSASCRLRVTGGSGLVQELTKGWKNIVVVDLLPTQPDVRST